MPVRPRPRCDWSCGGKELEACEGEAHEGGRAVSAGGLRRGGRLLGLEILAFDDATVARINEVLVSISIGHAALPERELAALRVA